jgi:hypothetical protein
MSDHPGLPVSYLTRARGLEAAPMGARWSSVAARDAVKRTFQKVARRCVRVIDMYPYVGVQT